MEPKQISCDQSPSQSSRYNSFIGRNLESYNWCGINEPQWRQIRACFHGWVILSNYSDDVLLWSLWNPLTSKLIHLPPLKHKEEDYHYCCLSSAPDDQASVFLLLSSETPTISFCRLDCKRKGLKWTEMSYAEQLRSISGIDGLRLLRPTCYNSKVYALTWGDLDYRFVIQVDIVVTGIEVVIRLQQFVKVPQAHTYFPTRNSFCAINSFLKGSHRELFFIEVCLKDKTRISGVSLFKLDTTRTVFEKMEDLKDAIFFIDLSTSLVFYKSVLASEIGGCVHIHHNMDKIIYSFYVKDRTMSLSLMPCSLQESQVFVWAMLECRLEVNHCKSMQEEKGKDIEIVIRQVKPDETESNSTTSESHLLNVPFHILVKIMAHCVGVEYMKFRATCKRCHLAAPMVHWSNKTTLRNLQTYSVVSPWLIVLDNYHGIITFIDPIFGDKYFIKKPKEMNGDCRILYSRYGWLLLHTPGTPQPWFFNPFTSNIFKLPEMPCLTSVCFSAPPTSPNCMVAGFTPFDVYIHFVSKEPFWRPYGLDTVRNDLYSLPIPTLSGRDIYFLCNNERIEAFRNMGEEDFSRSVVVDKAPISRCTSLREYFLSQCDQHLLLIIVGDVEESVEVFKLNDSTKEWEKINCLGKHMIFISYSSSFCLEAKSPEMENKIYFPRLLHNEDTKIVFYSLETCKYHIFDKKNIHDSFGVYLSDTKHYCYPHTWIEPNWS